MCERKLSVSLRLIHFYEQSNRHLIYYTLNMVYNHIRGLTVHLIIYAFPNPVKPSAVGRCVMISCHHDLTCMWAICEPQGEYWLHMRGIVISALLKTALDYNDNNFSCIAWKSPATWLFTKLYYQFRLVDEKPWMSFVLCTDCPLLHPRPWMPTISIILGYNVIYQPGHLV